MDEEEIVDQADTDPSDNEINIEGSGAFDPVTGAEAGAYDQPDAGRAPPEEMDAPEHEGADFIPFDQTELPAEATPTQGAAPAAAQPDFVPFGQESAAAAPAFIPFGKEPGTGVTKPGADDDNQFRGYIPTALRKVVQAMLQIDIPVEKGLARLIWGGEDNWLYQNAKWRGENAQGFVDTSPLRTTKAENESVTGRAAETLGNLAPLFLLGGGMGGVAAAGLQMGASGVESGAQRAKAAGADVGQQYQQGLAEGAIGLGVGAATMGAATLLKPFARSGPGMMNWAQTTLKEAAREGVVFGSAMEAQEYLGEKAAQAIYDPKAEYHFEMTRFLSGLVAGGAIGGARGAFQRYNPTKPTTGDAPPPDMAPPEGTPAENRQDALGAPAVNLGPGVAHDQVPASKTANVGDPQNVAGSDKGNTGRWAKRVERKMGENEPENTTGVVLLEDGQIAPDVAAALEPLKRPETPSPEPTGEPPPVAAPPPADVPPIAGAGGPATLPHAEEVFPPPAGGKPAEEVGPKYDGRPTPQQDVVQPHPDYLRSADNPPLPESPPPEITSQRAPEGSTPVPEAVTHPVTTAERESLPPVEPQARPTPDVSVVEPAAAPPPAPRAPRVLEDLSAPPRDFIPFQGQREEAPVKARVEERPRVEPERPREFVPFKTDEKPTSSAQYPVYNAEGRRIAWANEKDAAKRTRALVNAGDLMNKRFPFDGTKYDPRDPVKMKAYRDRAKEILDIAEAKGPDGKRFWERYLPKEKIADKDYRQAPPEALFMEEMLALAKKPFNQERAAKTLERELDLRSGAEGVDAVRAQRREEGNEFAMRRAGKLKEFDDTKHTEAKPDEAEKWLQENDDTWSKHLNRTLADC